MSTRYRSPRREDAAAATRTEILSRARDLFVTRGYAATTVPEIARAARVATQTVYASAGGKAAMFAELLRPAINDPTAAQAMTAAGVPPASQPQLRWLVDPNDYLRPISFDLDHPNDPHF